MIWLTAILFLTGLLSVCKAPAYPLWLLSVAVAGMPWLFAVIALAFLLAASLWVEHPFAEIFLSGMAFILFSIPIIRACWVSGNLQQLIGAEFGENGISRKPFDFWKMLSGPLEKKTGYRTLVYYSAPDISLSLDFYPSQENGRKPCVLVVHGGSWSSGNSLELPELNSRLAKAGYHVAALNYRLAPAYRNPSPVEDIRNALAYLREQAFGLQVDTGNFILLGRSAGGQIALLAAYTLNDPGIKGVVGFYAPADMVWGYSAPASPLVMNSRKVMEDYLGGSYKEVPQRYRDSSPLEAVFPGAVPTLLIHGKKDVLVAYGHSTRLCKKLKANQVKHFLLSLPTGTHGFDYVLDSPEGQLSTYCVEYFLKQVVRQEL